MKSIEVCLTPELIQQHDLAGKCAVIIDIFRATSCIVTGIAEGARAIYPVDAVDTCFEKGRQGMITAGERGGKKVEGFDLGNSPFDYKKFEVTDRDICLTTTNGTLAIAKSKSASEIVIGAFLNISATAAYLKKLHLPIVLHCAGWKGTPNVEDTLYAGALIQKLANDFSPEGDSAELALGYFQHNKSYLFGAASRSGHAKRLAGFGVTKDQEYCVMQDLIPFAVKLVGDRLVKA